MKEIIPREPGNLCAHITAAFSIKVFLKCNRSRGRIDSSSGDIHEKLSKNGTDASERVFERDVSVPFLAISNDKRRDFIGVSPRERLLSNEAELFGTRLNQSKDQPDQTDPSGVYVAL